MFNIIGSGLLYPQKKKRKKENLQANLTRTNKCLQGFTHHNQKINITDNRNIMSQKGLKANIDLTQKCGI